MGLKWVNRILGDIDICGVLRDFVPFAQFKKREKHPWRSANFNTGISYVSLGI